MEKRLEAAKEFSKFHDCEYFVHVDTGEIMEKPEATLEYEATTMPEWVVV